MRKKVVKRTMADLFDYAGLCANALYRYSQEQEENILYYSQAPLFKLWFYQAYLDNKEPNWDRIIKQSDKFVQNETIENVDFNSPIYIFFSQTVDGYLKEYEQRGDASTKFFEAMDHLMEILLDKVRITLEQDEEGYIEEFDSFLHDAAQRFKIMQTK